MDANAPLPDEADPTGPVDSDEEKDTVMAAIARSRPRPCEQHIYVQARRKYPYVRMKEMLGNALAGRGGPGGLFALPPPGTATITAATAVGTAPEVAVAVAGDAEKKQMAAQPGQRTGNVIVGPVPRKMSVAGPASGA